MPSTHIREKIWCLEILAVVLVFLTLAQGQGNVEDVRCALWHHSAMVKGNSIFIDGGVQTLRDNQTTWLGFNKYIYEFTLDHSWSKESGGVPVKRYERLAADNPNPPNMLRGGLFAAQGDARRLYTFGGSSFLANQSDPDWSAPSQDSTVLWSFDVDVGNWESYKAPAVPWRPNWGATAEDVINSVGFVLNGQYDRGTSLALFNSEEFVGETRINTSFDQIQQYLGGLVVIQLLTHEIKNISTESLGPPRVAGGLAWSPTFGKTENGTLLAFGGMHSSGGPASNTFKNGNLSSFSTVSLCDSYMDENVTWFGQITTGDIPTPRIDFCTYPWAIDANDSSSTNIYIYGGINPHTSVLYDDVYVLSVPSFTWTKIYSGLPGQGRFGHTCNAASTRQMFITGGARDASLYGVETTSQIPNLNATSCNGDSFGVRLFDVSNATFSSSFDFNLNNVDYLVPKRVVDVIGGSGIGNASLTEPRGGFAHAAIWTMFNRPASPTSSPNSTASPTDHGMSGDVIAGAVIGSVAGVTLGITAIWLLLRRKRVQSSPRGELTASELPGDTWKVEKDSAPIKLVTQRTHELEGDHPEPQELPTTEERAVNHRKNPSPRQSTLVEGIGEDFNHHGRDDSDGHQAQIEVL